MPGLNETRSGASDKTLQHGAAIAMWCGITFYIANPLAAALLLVAAALAAYGIAEKRDRIHVVTFGPLVAFFVWMGLSLLWTPNTLSASAAIVLYAVVLPSTLLGLACVGHIPKGLQRTIAVAFVVGFAVTAWVSLEEMLTDHFLRRALNTYIPLTRGRSIQSRADNGWILSLQSFVTNKNVAALMFMLWPALLMSRVLARRPIERWVRWATVAALASAVVLSDHESSKFALVVSAVVFVVALWSRHVAFGLVVFGWIAATLLVVPVARATFLVGAYKVEQIQFSGRHRVVIWGHTAERIFKNPVLGYGLASTRVIDETAPGAEKTAVPGTNIPSGINVHSHNMFLQIWHEIGAVGALLIMLAGLPVLAWLRTRSDLAAPYLLAAFATAVTIASLSWSLVAVWFVGSFGFMALCTRFADVVATSATQAE